MTETPRILSEQRVLEIAMAASLSATGITKSDAEFILKAAAPHIAVVVLIEAAKRFTEMPVHVQECRMTNDPQVLWKRAMEHASRELLVMAFDASNEKI